MSVLAIVPARGGSKGIPHKNIKSLAGKPLIGWTIDSAKKSKYISQIVVSTENQKIASIAREFGAEIPFMRPAALSADDTPGIEVVMHALELLPEVEWLLLLQPTSPLRSVEDIDGIIRLCFDRGASSAVSVVAVDKHPYWMYQCDAAGRLKPIVTERPTFTHRQDLPAAYGLNGALYLASRDWLLARRDFVGPDTLAYIMPAERSADLDTPMDWKWAEFLIEHMCVE